MKKGDEHGRWTVQGSPESVRAPDGRCYLVVPVRCACGTEKMARKQALLRGTSTGCKHCSRRGSRSNQWTGSGLVSGWLMSRIVRNAASRKRACTVTAAFLDALFASQGGRCALTGLVIRVPQASDRGAAGTASVDRIDQRMGYVPGNVRWVHKDVNMLRGTMTDEAFLRWCRLVALHA